jgi:hypothetical protein
MRQLPVEYGQCVCSGRYENRRVDVRMVVCDEQRVMADVPQGACPRCGARVYKIEVLERIETLMKLSCSNTASG